MKKREIDLFAVLLGLIIGGLFGYFIGTRINPENTKEVIDDTPIYGNVYLLQIMKSNDLDEIENVLKDTDIVYEAIPDNGVYYVYAAISTEDSVIEAKKAEFIALGFNPSIKSQYILDWPEKYNNEEIKYEFYNDAVSYLLDSINGESIIIKEKYLSNPVDLEIFSNISLIKSIKNTNIKTQLQLETYGLLFKKLN